MSSTGGFFLRYTKYHMIYNLITPPVYTDFLSLSDVKSHMRIDINTEDTLTTQYLEAAHTTVEAMADTLLGSQTWEASTDSWCSEMWFHKKPVTGLTSVKYYDPTTNTLVTVDPTLYRLIAPRRGSAKLEFDWNFTYPATYLRSDAIIIRFVAGLAVSPMAKNAIRCQVASFAENREGQGDPVAVRRACNQLRGY